MSKKMKEIPISAAKHIAHAYGYEQVIVYGRKTGGDGTEHGECMATYGTTREHCSIAARMGNTLKRFMGWPESECQAVPSHEAMQEKPE